MKSWFHEEGFDPDKLDQLKFATVKPKGAKVFLDDRAIRFKGPSTFSTIDELRDFMPWNQKS
jgi:hypothetical protein